MSNIIKIFYGRDVGYMVERIDVDQQLQAISATRQRVLLITAPGGADVTGAQPSKAG